MTIMQGEEMRTLRKSMGWTLAKLAEELGMSEPFVGLMERGQRPIEKRTELAIRFLALVHGDGTGDPDVVYIPRMKMGQQS
jgi:transcriptional regulator with XRE-family HTH domain